MMTLSEAAKALGAELHGEDVAFAAVNTDTRTLQQGDLFVALCGENFDGHAFVAQRWSACLWRLLCLPCAWRIPAWR